MTDRPARHEGVTATPARTGAGPLRGLGVLAPLLALSLGPPAAAWDYEKAGALIRAAEIVIPDSRVEYRDSGKFAYLISWPLTLGAGGAHQPCTSSSQECPAASATFLGADLLVEPQVAFAEEASARVIAGAVLHVGWVHSKEHEPDFRKGWAGALQLGGVVGADGNGVFAGLGFQPVGLVEGTRRTSLTYAFGLWLRAVHTARGDRIELGLDLLQLPWLVHL